MSKTILITGSTDGIGLEAARMLVAAGHHVLLHGRNTAKLEAAEQMLADSAQPGQISSYLADLSDMTQVVSLAEAISAKHSQLDVLINNAGIFKTSEPITSDDLDVRFVVNTLAPYLLVQRLMPLLDKTGRIVNLSSAAQSPVDLDAMAGKVKLDSDFNAYAQSKLAITAWSRHMALALGDSGPMVVAINPASMLGTKMVKDAFGVAGADIGIGADILVRAALSDEFATASGQYYDNDARQFGPPHPDALDAQKSAILVQEMENLIAELLSKHTS